MNGLKPIHQKFHQKVRQILWEQWDPIRIRNYGGPEDEYDAYAARISGMALRNASRDELADYLYEVEIAQMGLVGNRESALLIAEAVYSARETLT